MDWYQSENDMVRVAWRAIDEFGQMAPESDMARAAERGLCALRSLFPEAFQYAYNASPGFSMNFPVVNNFMWNYVCNRNRPVPPIPAPEYFYGGQCPILYFAYGKTVRANGTTASEISLANQLGPIQQFYYTRITNGTGGSFTYKIWCRDATGTLSSVELATVLADDLDKFEVVLQLIPAGGQPDNCGNRPIVPPPIPPLQQPSLDVDVEFGGQQRTVTFNFPEIDFSDPENIIFRPVVEFEGVRGEVFVDGIEITTTNSNYSIQGDSLTETTNNLTNNLNNVSNTVNQISNSLQQEFNDLGELLEVDFQEVLDAIERCCCKKGVNYNIEPIVTGTAGGRYPVPDDTAVVVITAELPFTDKTPVQIGSGDAERVYHWGSYSLNYAVGASGDRVPLQWAVQSIPCSEHCKGVTIWPTYGNTASAYALVRSEEE